MPTESKQSVRSAIAHLSAAATLFGAGLAAVKAGWIVIGLILMATAIGYLIYELATSEPVTKNIPGMFRLLIAIIALVIFLGVNKSEIQRWFPSSPSIAHDSPTPSPSPSPEVESGPNEGDSEFGELRGDIGLATGHLGTEFSGCSNVKCVTEEGIAGKSVVVDFNGSNSVRIAVLFSVFPGPKGYSADFSEDNNVRISTSHNVALDYAGNRREPPQSSLLFTDDDVYITSHSHDPQGFTVDVTPRFKMATIPVTIVAWARGMKHRTVTTTLVVKNFSKAIVTTQEVSRSTPTPSPAANESAQNVPTTDKAILQFSFFTNDTSAVPIRETTLPVVNGKVTVEFFALNVSDTAARTGEIIMRICKDCKFASEPPGFHHLAGSADQDRNANFDRIYGGTFMPKITADINVPDGFSRIQIAMGYLCDTCGKLDYQQFWVNLQR